MASDGTFVEDMFLHPDTSMIYFQSIVESSFWFNLLFSKIGAVLNIFHLIVLTRKTMMTTSINVIMIGIASCDLFLMVHLIKASMSWVPPEGLEWSVSILIPLPRIIPISQDQRQNVFSSSPPPTLFEIRFNWFLVSAHSGFRQCSAWLAVLLALINYLILTDITNQNSKFSKKEYGYKTIGITFLMSSIVSCLSFFNYKFVMTSTWHPETNCEEYSADWEEPVYSQKYIDLFEIHDALFSRMRLIGEGVFLKLLPCILLPALTGLLIYELNKTAKKFASSSVSSARQEMRKSRKDRSSIIVIFIAITFLLSEFPTGLFDIVAAIWHDDPWTEKASQTVSFMCDAIFTVNSSLHCLIYFSMSVQYRKTVYNMLTFPCSKRNSSQVTTVQRVSSSQQL